MRTARSTRIAFLAVALLAVSVCHGQTLESEEEVITPERVPYTHAEPPAEYGPVPYGHHSHGHMPLGQLVKAGIFRLYAGKVEMETKVPYPHDYYGNYYYQPWIRDWVNEGPPIYSARGPFYHQVERIRAPYGMPIVPVDLADELPSEVYDNGGPPPQPTSDFRPVTPSLPPAAEEATAPRRYPSPTTSRR